MRNKHRYKILASIVLSRFLLVGFVVEVVSILWNMVMIMKIKIHNVKGGELDYLDYLELLTIKASLEYTQEQREELDFTELIKKIGKMLGRLQNEV